MVKLELGVCMLRLLCLLGFLISYLLPFYSRAQTLEHQDKLTHAVIQRFQLPTFSKVIFIDPTLKKNCQRYDPQLRTCGKGSRLAVHLLSDASAMAKPGYLFLLRQGVYKQALHIKQSGNANAYIGFSAYRNESINIKEANSLDKGEEYGPIWLDEASYILINGLTVDKSIGFGRFLNAHHNVFSNNHFTGSTLYKDGKGASKRGGLYVAFSHHNRLINNTFEKGTDLLSLVHSNYNRVEGNTMTLAGHDVWSIKCGNFNIIRNNVFSNKNQKLGSVFDCEKGTMNWHGNGRFKQEKPVLDASQHNLIEHNIFKDAVRYYSASGGNGIQYAGQYGIIRFNVFYHTNIGFSFASYPPEASYNYSNRVYNNTFHDNWCAGIAVGRRIKKFEDNILMNNILWNNQGTRDNQCNNKNSQQILFSKKGDEWFVHNNIASDLGDKVIGLRGHKKAMSIYDFEGSFIPVQFDNTSSVPPLFVDEAKHNYRLTKESPMIDAGSHLTHIESDSGQGKVIKVQDSRYFYDGYGIQNELGDLIYIQSVKDKSIQQATIVKIERDQQRLYLDKDISWHKGDLISLPYQGENLDIGAYEFAIKGD